MTRQAKLFATGCCLLAVVVLATWFIRRTREVTYEGKTAARWFAEFCAAKNKYSAAPQRLPVVRSQLRQSNATTIFRLAPGNTRPTLVGKTSLTTGKVVIVTSPNVPSYSDVRSWFEDPAAKGLRGLGTNAALFLAREVCRSDPRWAVTYWKLRAKLPPILRTVAPSGPTPRLSVRYDADYALQALREQGAAAVPLLIDGFLRADTPTRSAIIQILRNLPRKPDDFDPSLDNLVKRSQYSTALDLIENLGLRTQKAGVTLSEILVRGDPGSKRRALFDLTYLGANNVAAVPALILTLTNADSELRYSAASALAVIGPEALTAAPALRGLTNDSSELVQRAAVRALSGIESAASQ